MGFGSAGSAGYMEARYVYWVRTQHLPPRVPASIGSPSLAAMGSLRCARKRPCGNCGRMPKDETCNIVRPVSYTHLTLPTICSV
eukprot:2554453-Prymnesium_polylepis.1